MLPESSSYPTVKHEFVCNPPILAEICLLCYRHCMTKKEEKGGIPALLGEGLAHVQHGIDKLTQWGFEVMKEQAEKAPPKETGNLYAREAKKAGRSVLKFLGKLGTGYYKKYEELKKKS